ncbi:carboxymuconolactone decarboxylase family protein [Sphingobacterium faecale]|uniref:Carboxymuconolactone decarboxylase family protein n=1 Tax=Sphingobacterium faecale TaxID=2803775 RepID=A0ABS1R206_9SPHI|nr:carboxymuconolactone decarboxylase family protein [Sphingobacterium faecale]MBL1408294.1 carboxymuconolactone decarboxylase family protein [Sphingobacterium faecale]
MAQRLNYSSFIPATYSKLIELDTLAGNSSLDNLLIHLVRLRASQINGCLFCVDIHAKQAVRDGENRLRLLHLTGWQESDLFSVKERAALLWTEALTRLSPESTNDNLYQSVKAYFSDAEIAQLTMIITLINALNRFGVAFRAQPGTLDKILGLDGVTL